MPDTPAENSLHPREVREAIARLDAERATLEARGAAVEAAEVDRRIAVGLVWLGRLDEASNRLTGAARTLERGGDPAAAGACERDAGLMLASRGRLRPALELLDHATNRLLAGGARRAAAGAALMAARIRNDLGLHAEAIGVYDRTRVRLAEPDGDVVAVMALLGSAMALIDLDLHDAAWARLARVAAHPACGGPLAAEYELAAAQCEIGAGRPLAGVNRLDTIAPDGGGLTDGPGVELRALAYLRMGRTSDAVRVLEPLHAAAAAAGDAVQAAGIAAFIGVCHDAAGMHNAAIAALGRARLALDTAGHGSRGAFVTLDLAKALCAAGRPRPAVIWCRRARRRFVDAGATMHVARCDAVAADARAGEGDLPGALGLRLEALAALNSYRDRLPADVSADEWHARNAPLLDSAIATARQIEAPATVAAALAAAPPALDAFTAAVVMASAG